MDILVPYDKRGKLRWQFILGFLAPLLTAQFGSCLLFVWFWGWPGFALWLLVVFAIAAAGG